MAGGANQPEICADLGKIDADETNIGELLEQTNEIVANLTRIGAKREGKLGPGKY